MAQSLYPKHPQPVRSVDEHLATPTESIRVLQPTASTAPSMLPSPPLETIGFLVPRAI